MRAIDDDLKILVPTADVMRAQLEKAATTGVDIASLVKQRQTKAEKKMTKLKRDMEQLHARMNKEGYTETVPEAIQEKNR